MRVIPLALTIAVLSAACGGPSAQPDSSGAHLAHDAYVTAINSNNLDAMLGVLTDDVVFLSANEPVMVGKPAVRKWLEAYIAAFKTHWDKPVQELIVDGDWAFERYSYKSSDVPVGGGPLVEDTGWGLVVYHHDKDGRWRVARDAFGPDHPAKGV